MSGRDHADLIVERTLTARFRARRTHALPCPAGHLWHGRGHTRRRASARLRALVQFMHRGKGAKRRPGRGSGSTEKKLQNSCHNSAPLCMSWHTLHTGGGASRVSRGAAAAAPGFLTTVFEHTKRYYIDYSNMITSNLASHGCQNEGVGRLQEVTTRRMVRSTTPPHLRNGGRWSSRMADAIARAIPETHIQYPTVQGDDERAQ